MLLFLHDAKIDNTNKFAPNFIIAVGDLGGTQEDQWELGIGQLHLNLLEST